MNDPLFSLRGVRRQLGESFRLRIDELTICRNEVFVLLGPTGAGKTTLLRLLTGLEHPDEGAIRFENALLGRGAALALLRRIAMVHQRPIPVHGSVEINVGYGLRVRGTLPSSKVRKMLDRLELGRLARPDARSLSGGQTQLVALARALVLEPEVLLLDEPTANLDPAHVALVEKVIAEMQAEQQSTVVWATHNLFQARRVGKRVALLLNGEIAEVGATQAFFENPADPRTAAFVQGKMVY